MLLTDTELQLKKRFLFQKFFAGAKIKLQNLICFAFQTRGATLCSALRLSRTLVFSNGNSFVPGKHEWLDLKLGMRKYTVSKTECVTW